MEDSEGNKPVVAGALWLKEIKAQFTGCFSQRIQFKLHCTDHSNRKLCSVLFLGLSPFKTSLPFLPIFVELEYSTFDTTEI